MINVVLLFFFFFQAEDGIRDYKVTGVQTCALPIYPARAAIFELVAAGLEDVLHGGGHPEVHAPADEGAVEALGGDADDGVHDAVKALRLADDLRIATEATLPELITDHRDRMRALTCVLLWKKPAAENRVHSDGIKIIRGDDAAGGALGAIADAERGAGNFADEDRFAERAT